MSQSWHFCDIARLRMGFRFRWKSGRAADITLTTEFGPKRSSGAFTRFACRPYRPRDGSVVSSLHCMNDPQPEGHMASHIERRKFLATLGGAAAAWPLAARAQQARKRIGFLGTSSLSSERHLLDAFVQSLRELGHVDGENIVIEPRWAEGRLAVVLNPANPPVFEYYQWTKAAAAALGLTLQPVVELREIDDFKDAFSTIINPMR